MNVLDVLWISSIGAGFVSLLILTLIFWAQQGRVRKYLAALLVSFTILALISLVTALESTLIATIWFKIPRALGWLLVAVTSTRMILFQVGYLNRENKN